jgi:hypothetical protein
MATSSHTKNAMSLGTFCANFAHTSDDLDLILKWLDLEILQGVEFGPFGQQAMKPFHIV